jgi:hypothetical protein
MHASGWFPLRMTRTHVDAAPDGDADIGVISWENRLGDSIGLSPISTGLLIAGVLYAAFLAAQWALGLPVWRDDPVEGLGFVRSARVTALVVGLLGFSTAANLYLPRAIYRDQVRSLVEDPTRQRMLLEIDPLRVPRDTLRRSRWAGWTGVVVALIVIVLLAWTSDGNTAREYDASAALTPVLFWILARSMFSTLWGAREFEREIDLLNLRPHYVAGRIGLRLALVWLSGTAISILILSTTGLSPVLLPVILMGIGVGAIAFVLPVRGLHLNIRAEKRAALAALQPELHRALDESRHRDGSTAHAGHLADLLALRAHLENVREWPFDNTTLWRFGLYTLIPLGSWVGGALVERVLEVALR